MLCWWLLLASAAVAAALILAAIRKKQQKEHTSATCILTVPDCAPLQFIVDDEGTTRLYGLLEAGIDRAEKQIVVVGETFVDTRVAWYLVNKSKADPCVKITVVAGGMCERGEAAKRILLQRGIPVLYARRVSPKIHTAGIIIDGCFVILGSLEHADAAYKQLNHACVIENVAYAKALQTAVLAL